MINRSQISSKNPRQHQGGTRKDDGKYIKRYKRMQRGIVTHRYGSEAIHGTGCGEWLRNGLCGALCVPYPIRDLMRDGGVTGDPKGAGASTTSRRYSRKTYRQSAVFSIPSPIPTLKSNLHSTILVFAMLFSMLFTSTPGVLVTLKKVC